MAKIENDKTPAAESENLIAGSGTMVLIPALGVVLPRSAVLSVAFDVYSTTTSTLIPDNTPNFPMVSEEVTRAFDATLRISGKHIDLSRIETLGYAPVYGSDGTERPYKDDEESDDEDEDSEAEPESIDDDESAVKVKEEDDENGNGVVTVYFTNVLETTLSSANVSLKMSAAYQDMASKKDNARILEKNLEVMARHLETIRKEVGVIDDLDAGDDALDAVTGGGTAQQQHDEDVEEAKEKFEERVEFFKNKVVNPFNNAAGRTVIIPDADDGEYFTGIGEVLSIILVDVD